MISLQGMDYNIRHERVIANVGPIDIELRRKCDPLTEKKKKRVDVLPDVQLGH